jgi:hypothetical protein
VVTSVIGLYVAGVVVVSFEGLDISESWDIVSPVRHSLSARRHSRIPVENGAVQQEQVDQGNSCPHVACIVSLI